MTRRATRRAAAQSRRGQGVARSGGRGGSTTGTHPLGTKSRGSAHRPPGVHSAASTGLANPGSRPAIVVGTAFFASRTPGSARSGLDQTPADARAWAGTRAAATGPVDYSLRSALCSYVQERQHRERPSGLPGRQGTDAAALMLRAARHSRSRIPGQANAAHALLAKFSAGDITGRRQEVPAGQATCAPMLSRTTPRPRRLSPPDPDTVHPDAWLPWSG